VLSPCDSEGSRGALSVRLGGVAWCSLRATSRTEEFLFFLISVSLLLHQLLLLSNNTTDTIIGNCTGNHWIWTPKCTVIYGKNVARSLIAIPKIKIMAYGNNLKFRICWETSEQKHTNEPTDCILKQGNQFEPTNFDRF
jgi:hypothetical protein